MGLGLTLEPGLWTPASRLVLSLASRSRVGLAWPGRRSAPISPSSIPQPLSGLPSPWWPVTRLTGHQAHHDVT